MAGQRMNDCAGTSYTRKDPFVVDARIERMIAGAVGEVDLQQIAILRTLTPAQRMQQAASMIEAAEQVAVHRLRLREPELSAREARRIVCSGSLMTREIQKRTDQACS